MDLLTPHFGLFFYHLIAFLIVVFILGKFAWKPILNTLSERENKIADSIATADKVRAEMNQMQADNEKLLAEAREERSRILKEAKDAKNKMIEDAKGQAKVEAEKIITNARLQIENEKKEAIVEVKNQIGILAVGVAEKILKKELSSENSQQEFIQKLAADISLN